MYPVSSEGLNKETDKAVYFFTPAFAPLDNFSAHVVCVWGLAFPTSEHAYQWKKYFSAHPEIAEEILAAPSPHAAKDIANKNVGKLPSSWQEERVRVMEEALRAKAAQHEDVREALKRTGKRMIIENSPVDSFWGAGPDGKGENMLGKVWMKIRDSSYT
ncbi:MAG: NADAR family protein [Candidatus Liptonbacteria bacterium]|nr:NADAR family protein [Candidatus Liptonbacteria bacterium]